MKYIVELSDMSGDGLTDSECSSRFESPTPIPAPNVGDELIVSGSSGKSGSAQKVQVINRRFYIEEDSFHIQVFCEEC